MLEHTHMIYTNNKLYFTVMIVSILASGNRCMYMLVSGPLSPSLSAKLPPIDLTLPEQHELGYMPLRDDFERVKFVFS